MKLRKRKRTGQAAAPKTATGKAGRMWDGRFSKPTDRLMEAFNNSLPFDKALVEEDLAGSMAWAAALGRAGVLTKNEAAKIQAGLRAIAGKARKGALAFLPGDEDIHMAIERILTERIGAAGKRLHTGRSRNDQVATDTRLYVKRSLAAVARDLADLQKAVLARAGVDKKVIIPAYTHLQQAQPILLAHYWLSLFFLLDRERDRLVHALLTTDACPLGSGAVAGAGFAVDRQRLAADLGFARPTENSIDGVATRDFALEALAAVASIGISLSRYAEDLIVWSSREFSFVELDDAWSSGSSMMPQKKNPDSLELIRGKCGRFIGNYMRLAATLKGVGLAYYKDLQEDKEPIFDSFGQITMVIAVFTQVLATLTVKEAAIERQLDSLLFATDIADYLVSRGLPFRQAHRVVGRLVAHCIEKKTTFRELPLSAFKTFSPLFNEEVKKLFSWKSAISHRDIEGGTGEKSVARQLQQARLILKKDRAFRLRSGSGRGGRRGRRF